MDHVLGTTPKKVAVVGCGPSMQDYVNIKASHKPLGFDVDEVWAINAAGVALNVDLTFIMDDAVFMQAAESEMYNDVSSPIITSVARQDNAHTFPLAEALSLTGARDYFNHTGAYIVAYAILIGVKEICLFGCDYISHQKNYTMNNRYADLPPRYMACMAFWCGMAAARGTEVIVTPNSPLLDADAHDREKFYGYAVPPIVKREGE